MPRKLLALCLALLLVFGLCPGAFAAEEPAEAALRWHLQQQNAATPQELIHRLAENPGSGEEWLVLALCHAEEGLDFSVYKAALEDALPDITDPADKLRAALALSAFEYSETAAKTAEEAMGQRGIMSWIYGLLVLDSRGYPSDLRTTAVHTLLGLQKADGGWALSGEHSDTDVTAMAVQALAPYRENRHVAAAIKNAMGRLAELQNDAASFASYGVPNAESCAQVLLMLNALGLSAEDEFTANGRTVTEAMLDFQLADGGFAHQAETPANAMATTQALLALTALQLDAPLYVFETSEHTGLLPPDFMPPESTAVSDAPTASADDLPLDEDLSADDNEAPVLTGGMPLKFWVLCGAAALWVLWLGCVLFKRKKSAVLTAAVVGAVIMLVLWLVPIESPAEYNARMAQGHTAVTVTIDCSRAGEQLAENNLPADGILLDGLTVHLPEGATVYDALQAAARRAGFAVEATGLPGSMYVRGIAGLREFDAGELSGWVYRLNGETISRSCDGVPVENGDTLVWVYTLDLGNDISP